MKQIIITTMCALINNKNEVLFIDRQKEWKGLALPGGHIEDNESIVECVRREIYEETGFVVSNLLFKGITHFFNIEIDERYMVFNFTSYDFHGDFKKYCPEGNLQWIPKNQFDRFDFAEGMEQRFDLFFSEGVTEMYVEWNQQEGYKRVESIKI